MPYFHHFISDSPSLLSSNGHHNNASSHNSSSSSAANNGFVANGAANQQRSDVNGMVKQVKSGYLLHHKKRLFGKAWREHFVVLYEDSSVIWFRDRDRLDPEGGLFLRDAPEMLAAGQWVARVPNKPEFPEACDMRQSIAIGSRSREKVHWFLCKSDDELIEWMTAIGKTLPPPPPPPLELRESRINIAISLKIQQIQKQQQQQQQEGQAPKRPQPAMVLQGGTNHQQDQHVSPYPRHPPLPPPKDYGATSSRFERIRNSAFTDHSRSYSSDRLISAGPAAAANYSGNKTRHHQPNPPNRPVPPPPPPPSIPNGAVTTLKSSSKPAGTSVSDVNAAIGMAGMLTQYDTALAATSCWDWGMGWGWTGLNAAFCGTCAMEQAALTNHLPGLHSIQHQSTTSLPAMDTSAQQQMFYDAQDDPGGDLGDMGGEGDMACDFGGDCGAF